MRKILNHKIGWYFIVLLSVALLLSIPLSDANAQLVPPCSELPGGCQFCHIMELGNNLINFAIMGLATPLAALAFAWAGLLYVTAAGSSDQITRANSIFKKVLIGFVFILGAWLLVDTIITASVSRDFEKRFGPWNEFKCVAQPTGSGSRSGSPSSLQVGQTCTTCVVVPFTVPVKIGACSGSEPCKVAPALIGPLVDLADTLDQQGIKWRVTEAWPPIVQHQNACHSRGTCVDANFTTGTAGTPENIKDFINTASRSGLRAIYEVKTAARLIELQDMGIINVDVVPRIDAEHFSVYLR